MSQNEWTLGMLSKTWKFTPPILKTDGSGYIYAEDPQRKTRKKGPKSRTGCKTCKSRRIKCDERKPSCLRCEKFGVTCAGYDAPRLPVIFVEPKQQIERRLAKLAPGPRLPFEFSFADVKEEGYFRLFCDETAAVISDGDCGQWKTLILQACHAEPSILQFTTAISALDRACRERDSGTPVEHHQYALQKYQKAVKGIQQVIATRKDTLRIALIAALLIFCFENFHGDIETAAQSTKSAVDCLYAWLEKTPRGSGGLSPKPSVLEDELVGIFCRLGRLIVIYSTMHKSVDGTKLAARNNDLNPAATLLRTPPLKFKKLSEAKKYWDYLAEYTFQYMARMRNSPEPLPEVEEKVLDFQRSRIAEGLRLWSEAFDPILKRSWTPEGEADFITVTTMHISCHMRAVDVERERLRKTHSSQEIDHIVLPQYATIVSLCRRVIEHPGFVKGFVLEFGILADLFITAVKCRDSLIRGTAVKLLKMARPRREAFWDSGVLATMAEGVISAERGQVDEKDLEETVEEVEDIRLDDGIGTGIPGWEPEEISATEWEALRKFSRR